MTSINTTLSYSNFKKIAEDCATRATTADIQGKTPLEDIQALRTSGYLGLNIPKKFGGFGYSMKECMAAQLELAQGSASTALIAGMQMQVFGNEIGCRNWSDDHFEAFCTQGAQGALFNSAASEPKMGSPSRGGLPATQAFKNSENHGTWVLSGQKTWVTGGENLTHMLVRCRIEDDPAVMLVTQDLQGIQWTHTWKNALSLRASESDDVIFDQVIVPEGNLVEKGTTNNLPNAWFPMVMGSVYLGSALGARNAVIKYALERVPTALGKPIASLPKIQRQIGEIDLILQPTREFFLRVAGEWDNNGSSCMSQITAAKHLSVESALKVTEKALEIAGGASLTKSLPLERYFRDVRAGMMQPPSGDTALEIIGRNAIDQFNQ